MTKNEEIMSASIDIIIPKIKKLQRENLVLRIIACILLLGMLALIGSRVYKIMQLGKESEKCLIAKQFYEDYVVQTYPLSNLP